MKTLLLVLLFLAFTIPSTVVLVDEGVVGLVHLVQREPWALQILVDLVIACSVFVGWMWRDAPTRGIRAWPYVIAIAAAGSIGVLAYLIRRRFTTPTAAA